MSRAREYTRERLISDYQDLAIALGRPPIDDDLGSHNNTASHVTYRATFLTMNELRQAAGIDDPSRQYAKDKLISNYQILALKLGRVPTEEDLGPHNGTASRSFYRKIFGTMAQLREEAGTLSAPKPWRKYTREFLIHRYLALEARLGCQPRVQHFGGDFPPYSAYRKEFGGLPKARMAVWDNNPPS